MTKSELVEATIEIDDVDVQLEIVEYSGREAIGELFELSLTVAAAHPLDVDSFISGRAVLRFSVGEQPVRAIEGMISHCVDLLTIESEHAHYRLRLVPMLWRSTLVELIDIYMDLDIQQLVEKKLGLAGFTKGQDLELRLLGAYPEREFVVQYQENDARFLARQVEHEGISFFFEHDPEEDREVLVFGDHNAAFRPIGDGTLPFRRRGEHLGVYELTHATGTIPSQYVQRDYNYRQPGTDITADVAVTGPGRLGGFYEYGAHFKTQEDAGRIATVRAQEQACRQRTFEGRAALPQLRAGGRVTITGHPRGDLDLVITAVEHHGTQGFRAKDGPNYECRFEAIRADETFRPRRATPKPRINGLLTGVVEASSDSDYADVDDQGRYRVRFLFDTAGPGERQASRPVRMMQPHAGPGYGMHFPLRGGIEVLIAFVGGDPDRPIIAGTLPNPHTPSPVTSGNRERNIIRTGAGNEINIDDTTGTERVKISTPRSSALLQLGAPNAPEDGALLSSATSVTNAGTASVNQAGAFSNSWSLWDSAWSNHVVSVAGKGMLLDVIGYSLDTVRGSVEHVSNTMGTAITVADTVQQLRDGEVEAAQEALEAAEAALAAQTPPTSSPEEVEEEKRQAVLDEAAAIRDQLAAAGQAEVDSKLGAYDDAVIELEKKETALEAEEEAVGAALAEKQQERAVLAAKLAKALESSDAALMQSLGSQISTLDGEIKAEEKKVTDAQEAVAKARDDRDKALDDVDAAVLAEAGKAKVSTQSYTATKDAYDVYYAAVRRVEELTAKVEQREKDLEDHQNAWKGPNEAKSWIDDVALPAWDSAVGIPYSYVSTILGSGLGSYAAACSNIMVDEARAQREGSLPKVAIIDEAKYGRKPKQKPSLPARTNSAWGPLSRIEWLPDNEKDAINLKATPMGLMAFEKPWQTALAVGMSTLLGPIAGAFAFQFLSKNAAFEEARNIQGSEQKAILFGKQSVFVNGQEQTTIASGKKLLLTSNDEAVFHTRGAAEVVGIDSVYVASAKQVDVLSRGTYELKVTDRGGGDTVGDDKALVRFVVQPTGKLPTPKRAPGPAGSLTADVLLAAFDNDKKHNMLSNLHLRGQKATVAVNGAGQHKDASILLECKQRGAVQSYLELKETASEKVAKLLGGTFGLDADGGSKKYAKLTSGSLELKVTDTDVTIGTPNKDAHLAITSGGATKLRGDGVLELSGKDSIALVSGKIEFGGAKIDHVNLMVKEGPSAAVAKLRTLINQAKSAEQKAAKEAEKALEALKKMVKDKEDKIAKSLKELDDEQKKGKKDKVTT